jgi:hypothetical protein
MSPNSNTGCQKIHKLGIGRIPDTIGFKREYQDEEKEWGASDNMSGPGYTVFLLCDVRFQHLDVLCQMVAMGGNIRFESMPVLKWKKHSNG